MQVVGVWWSAGQQREVTGVHDEAGVQVEALWGETQGLISLSELASLF